MSDRELLELAAKAAGRSIWWSGPVAVLHDFQPGVDQCSAWNPLTDDGDAFRLAVKTGLTVYAPEKTATGMHVCVVSGFGPDAEEVWQQVANDPYAATRRAIVRAAADIAKAEGRS